ncbi:MAG: TFIIB-type zinc ribbon-containing protein, partial [Planctomycetota bacterium]
MTIVCANCGRAIELEGPSGGGTKCSCGNKITIPARAPRLQPGVASCTNCWKRYGVVGRPIGTRFKCKACGQIITIRKASDVSAAPKSQPVRGSQDAAGLEHRETVTMEAVEVEQPKSKARALEEEAAAARESAELAELRAAVQRYKEAAETNDGAARAARSQVEKKSRDLEEKEAELARLRPEVKSLQERVERQSGEIASLEQKTAKREEELADGASRMRQLEETVKERDEALDERAATIASHEARVKELEKELAARPTHEEVERFRAEKEDFQKRLDDGAGKVAALREVIAKLREPLFETLKRFEQIGIEAGSINLPDIYDELSKARSEAEEKERARAKLGDEVTGLKDELEQVRGELATALKEREETVRKADEEIERLQTADEEKPGFFGRIFGGQKKTARARKARAPSKPGARGTEAEQSGDEVAVEPAEAEPVEEVIEEVVEEAVEEISEAAAVE